MRLPAAQLSGLRVDEGAADALVLGAGPAGSAAAAVLAQEGRRVVLIRPSRTPEGALGESVPPSARKLLMEIGALEAVEAAGFVPNVGNTVHWGGRPVRRERFGDGAHGFHVDRRGLESVLCGVAERAGVTVLDGLAARSAERREGIWAVSCRGPDGRARVLRAPWVVDATGRHGFLARRLGRRSDERTRTTAVVGRWRVGGRAPEEVRGHTVIDSYEDGWCWSVPVSSDVRCFAAMLDPKHAALDPPTDLRGLLERHVRRGRGCGTLLDEAEAVGPAWACPATLYEGERFGDEGLVVCGDAASFIDPLSSYGVKKALSSGWMAALAVNTALADGGMAGAALEAHERREREVVRRYRAQAADYLGEAAAAHAHPYWSERAEAARAELDSAGEDPAPPALAAAYERIRGAPRLAARPAGGLARVAGPVVEGRRIVLEEHLTLGDGRRFRHHGPVDLRRLVEVAADHGDVPDLWAAYQERAAPVPLPDFLRGLSYAFAAGLLEWAEGAGPAAAGGVARGGGV